MPTWLSIVIGVLGAFGAGFGMYIAFKKGIRDDATGSGELRADVKYIIRSVDDIRIDLKTQDKRQVELFERVTRVEESTKSAHHRLNKIENIKEEN